MSVVAARLATYGVLRAPIGLGESTTTAIAGSLITAVLLHGMLFEGMTRTSRERLIAAGTIVLLAAAVYGAQYVGETGARLARDRPMGRCSVGGGVVGCEAGRMATWISACICL